MSKERNAKKDEKKKPAKTLKEKKKENLNLWQIFLTEYRKKI